MNEVKSEISKCRKTLDLEEKILVELVHAEIEYYLPEEVTKKIMYNVHQLSALASL